MSDETKTNQNSNQKREAVEKGGIDKKSGNRTVVEKGGIDKKTGN